MSITLCKFTVSLIVVVVVARKWPHRHVKVSIIYIIMHFKSPSNFLVILKIQFNHCLYMPFFPPYRRPIENDVIISTRILDKALNHRSEDDDVYKHMRLCDANIDFILGKKVPITKTLRRFDCRTKNMKMFHHFHSLK